VTDCNDVELFEDWYIARVEDMTDDVGLYVNIEDPEELRFSSDEDSSFGWALEEDAEYTWECLGGIVEMILSMRRSSLEFWARSSMVIAGLLMMSKVGR
jgi:hypothetical protein